MSAHKIKHIPTGLFYQPHKHRGNNLSKNGKVYAIEGYAKLALKSIAAIQLEKGGRVYNIVKDILPLRDSRYAYNQVIAQTSEKDWEIVEI